MYRKFLKRFLDLMLSFGGLIILSPLFLLLIVLIKLDSTGPVLFKQNRITAKKQVFKIYKFRTMRIDTPQNTPTHLLNQAENYITKVGSFLRMTSLDELPQLINILKGEMSVVGPRPCLPNQTDLLAERDKYDANDARPGLTGLAQISGRDELPIPTKAKLDGKYVKQITFKGDLRIFAETFVSVLKHDGVKEGQQ